MAIEKHYKGSFNNDFSTVRIHLYQKIILCHRITHLRNLRLKESWNIDDGDFDDYVDYVSFMGLL